MYSWKFLGGTFTLGRSVPSHTRNRSLVGDNHFTKGKVASVTATIALLFVCLSKVIPLSQRSGIVEWCEDTLPLGEYLIGRPGTKTGAHSRYYPGDWTSLDCRKKVKVNRLSSCFPGGLVVAPMMEAWSNPNLNPNPHAPSGLTLTTEINIFCFFFCVCVFSLSFVFNCKSVEIVSGETRNWMHVCVTKYSLTVQLCFKIPCG